MRGPRFGRRKSARLLRSRNPSGLSFYTTAFRSTRPQPCAARASQKRQVVFFVFILGHTAPHTRRVTKGARAVRAVRLLLAHWRPLAVTDTRLAAVSRGHPHTRGRQSATYTVCVLGTGPPWWPMSSIGLVVRGCTHRSLPVVWRGAGTYRWPPRAGGGSDRPEIPMPSARDFPGGDPTYPPWRPTGHVAAALYVWCACAMHATAVARAPCHACGPRRAGDRHSPVARAGSGRRHAPPRTDRGLRDAPSTSLRAGHRWSRPAHKIAFFRSMVTSVLD